MAWRTLALLTLAACPAPTTGGSDKGTVQEPRLISLSPALTDAVVALGAGAHLVGISQYCPMPQARQLPRLGGVHDASLERIAGLRPTLILSTASKHGPAKQLQQAGLPVHTFSEGRLQDILKGFEVLGETLGVAEEGRRLRDKVTEQLNTLAGTRKGPKTRVLVVFSSEGEPLHTVWAAGPGGWLGDLLEHLGFANVLTSGPSYAQISVEGLLALAPDLVVEIHGSKKTRAQPMTVTWGALKQLPAVKNKRLHRLTGEAYLRPGPRLIELAKELASLR